MNDEAVDFVRTSTDFIGGSGGSISAGGTTVGGYTWYGYPFSGGGSSDPDIATLTKLLYLSQSLKCAHEAHLISGEHASSIYKRFLKQWGLDVKKKGGE